MLINVKIPTLNIYKHESVGIFIFISMINTSLDSLKARKVFIFSSFLFLWSVEILYSVELSMKKCHNLRACFMRSGAV